MSTQLVLEANPRGAGGSAVARRLRGEGVIPAVVYGGGGAATSVTVAPKAVKTVLSTSFGWNNVFQLAVDGANHQCMVKDWQFDPVRRVLTHIDFYVVDSDQKVVIDVPVEAVGTSAGVRAGGRLQILARTVRLRCSVKDITATVPYDVTDVKLGDTVSIEQFTPPTGCEFVFRNRFPVLRIARKRGAKVGEEG